MGERNEKLDLESYLNDEKLLHDLLEKYFQPMMSYKQNTNQTINIKTTKNTHQDKAHYCGVFLLMFIKHLVLKRKFDFDTRCIEVREAIKEELLTKKFMKETKPGTRKRKQSMHSSEIPRKINNHFRTVQWLYRTFKDPDNETC